MAFHEIRKHSPDAPVRAFTTENIVFPAHWHEDVELVVILEGRMDFFLEGERHALLAGDGVLAAPRAIHAYGGGGCRVAIFIFPPLAALPSGVGEAAIPPLRSRVLRAAGAADGGVANGRADSPLVELARLGVSTAAGKAAGKALVLFGVAAALRGLFADRTESGEARGEGGASGEARIRRALAYLEDHYAGKVSAAAAASAAGLSPCYFSRLFPRLAGARFVDWVAFRRLAEAERLLADSDLGIAEIAEESGFGGIRALDRAFASRRGMNPREYRLRSAAETAVRRST